MSHFRMRSLVFFGAAACLLLVSSLAFAQHIRGALEGTVVDQAGAVIAGAKVTLQNPATGKEITAATNERGSFNFQNLEPGTYTVTVEKSGFRR